MFELFYFPFVQRALLGGVLIAILLGWMGVFVTTRKMSFIGAGVAHASLASIALAILMGWAPLPTALIASVFLGILLYYLDRKTNVSRDTAIGMLFSSGMALGVLLLQFNEGYVPELMSFLFGNILTISQIDLYVLASVSIVLMLLLMTYYRQLLFVTVDPQGAYLSGIARDRIELMLYIFTSVSVVVSIKLVGIVLVTALLVIPAATSQLISHSFASFLRRSILLSLISVLAGLCISLFFDLPSGASIVLTATTLFIFVRFFAKN